jgi:prepilin-type N-terminal cleavage/methylation domain-containing protein
MDGRIAQARPLADSRDSFRPWFGCRDRCQGPNRNDHSQGFSLIELLLVVAIILIISAIAIPNLLRSRIAANESATVASMRQMNTALNTYNITYPRNGFPASLVSMGPPGGGGVPTPDAADLLDSVLSQANPQKTGYQLAYQAVGGGGGGGVGGMGAGMTRYTLTAIPLVQNGTGIRSFFTDNTGVIHACDPGIAVDANCPAIQ